MRSLAYLDPGSGSMIVSAVAAGIAGVAVVFKMGWRRFAMLFSARKRAEHRAAKEAAGDAS